jgi:MSHA biogenesis protein MshI
VFSRFKNKSTGNELTGIGFDRGGVCVLSAIDGDEGKPRVTDWEYQTWLDTDDHPKIMASLCRKHQLGKKRCATVLEPDDYRLLVVDAPDVPREEMADALRWRIKDVVDFDMGDAVLDIFDFPADSGITNSRSCYVVVAQYGAIEQRINLLEKAGADLRIIDIPEMAIRNISSRLPRAEVGIAMLSLGDSNGLLTLSKGDTLYMSRSLNISFPEIRDALDQAFVLERLTLEVQRSLDYYVSHFHQEPINQIMLAPLPGELPEIENDLRQQLGIAVESLHLQDIADWDKPVPVELESHCLTALGAALREVH